MYGTDSYQLTQDEFNYLLPAIKSVCEANGKYFFIGTIEDLADMLNRLKGLYDKYHQLPAILIYNCSKWKSLKPFREIMQY